MLKNYDPLLDPDFVGYNCRDPEATGDLGVIENIGDYAEEYYPAILESFIGDLKSKAEKKKLFNFPKVTDLNFKEWADKCHKFFKDNGIRWIFVREELPANDQDSQFYYVSIPEEKMLCSFDYSFDSDEIRIVVYPTKGEGKIKPKMIIVPDEFSDDFDEDFYDDDLDNEDKSDGESYWEDVWKG